MLRPNRKNLANRDAGSGIWQSTSIHLNAQYYKYRWQIYTADSPWEEEVFFANAPQLCTHDAMMTVEKLSAAGQSYIVYNQRLPRRGPGVPFELTSARWKDYEFASAYDDDPDPVWNGFK